MLSVPELFSLAGKTAVLTGATRSIGAALAIALAEAGADIISIQVRQRHKCSNYDPGRALTNLSYRGLPQTRIPRKPLKLSVANATSTHAICPTAPPSPTSSQPSPPLTRLTFLSTAPASSSAALLSTTPSTITTTFSRQTSRPHGYCARLSAGTG